MTTTQTDLQELKNLIGERFNELKGDIAEVKHEVDLIHTKVVEIDKTLAVVDSKLDSTEKRLGTVEGNCQILARSLVN